MYIIAYKSADNTYTRQRYDTITNLIFEPSADLVGASLPINEFAVDIKTTDDIDIGHYAELHADDGTLWANYWVIYAEHIDENTVSIRAQSDIAVLDRVVLPAVYYNEKSLSSALNATIVGRRGGTPLSYSVDSSFAGETLTGFLPEQTARERLMWICFAIGGYVKTFFNSAIEILPIDSTQTSIPLGDTYYKPVVTYNDWVTAISAKSYSFDRRTPSTTEQYVQVSDDEIYVVTETEVTLANPDAPSAAPENVIHIDGVYLLNEDNVSAILSRLAQWYFKRIEIDMDAINNGSYVPGDNVLVCTDEKTMYEGYINSASFVFGAQAKSSLHLTAAESRPSGNLTIKYYNGSILLSTKRYLFPVGYAYAITNPYIDAYRGRHRYVYRPENETATGTIQAGSNTNTQNCDVALDLYQGVLHIISVDEFDTEMDEGITEGVIG